MTINIHYKDIQETFEARNADEALSIFKKEAAKRSPFAMRVVHQHHERPQIRRRSRLARQQSP